MTCYLSCRKRYTWFVIFAEDNNTFYEHFVIDGEKKENPKYIRNSRNLRKFFISIEPEIYKWFVEHELSLDVFCIIPYFDFTMDFTSSVEYILSFKNKTDALLFKLTFSDWG